MSFRMHDPRLLKAAGICFLLAAFFLSLIVLAGCSHSITGKALNVGVMGAKLADQLSTDAAEARGAREGNPVLGNQQWQQVVASVLGAGSVILSARLVEQQKPILAHLLRGFAIAVWTGVAIHNHQVQR